MGLRSMHRRLNYDLNTAALAADLIEMELIERTMGARQLVLLGASDKVEYYIGQYTVAPG